ncbi:OsmC family protein [Pseudooceanicola aestuarii]|uniref:OsmC family protein n=1 Tax=Pseudooceanicola aestuarii TaxID=2697319 RepID=UPI0013CFEFCD|nr:OsmC family protein [Pseudooceanicola aestuarii]
MPEKATNILGPQPAGLIHEASHAAANQLETLRDTRTCRMVAWSLSGFQKVAVLSNAATGRAWRMASDEGPNLNGWDAAPPPLGFLSVGLALAYAQEIRALARLRGVDPGAFGITVDNYYSVQGQMRAKTMVGGALPFGIEIAPEHDLDETILFALVSDALHVAPVADAVRGTFPGAFNAWLNGAPLDLSHPVPDTAAPADPAPICREGDGPADSADILTSGDWSRPSEAPHPLHVSARGRVLPDGALDLWQELRAPCGSGWRFRAGGADAPDAVSYVSAGIGFCFMTQLEILAGLLGIEVSAVRLVQDTRFGPGGATSGTGLAPGFAPVESHLFVESGSATPAQIVELIDLAERACYLHALCRTPLKPQLRIRGVTGAPA